MQAILFSTHTETGIIHHIFTFYRHFPVDVHLEPMYTDLVQVYAQLA